MAKQNWQKCLESVLESEGGFVNHPSDPGGITNLGVTKAAYEEYLGRSVTEQEMRDLAPDDVIDFYKKKYWDVVKGDELPSGVDYAVFDFAVNSGPGRAAKFLQEAIGVTADGAIGPVTMKAIQDADARQIIEAYSAARLAFLKELPTWDAFGRGWERRVTDVRRQALLMLHG